MYRQGDILIIPVAEIPVRATRLPREHDRLVIAKGEATGHAHVIIGDDLAELVGVSDEVDRWLRVRSPGATLAHNEHGAILLPVGDYVVRRQREYSPAEIRLVAD